jgi:hypothetical protein
MELNIPYKKIHSKIQKDRSRKATLWNIINGNWIIVPLYSLYTLKRRPILENHIYKVTFANTLELSLYLKAFEK